MTIRFVPVCRWFVAPLAAVVMLLGGVRVWAADALIFAAASTTGVVTELIDLFDAQGHGRLVASFASSSALAKQIANGAPADIYLSANVRWMDYLEENGRITPSTRRDLLGNRLVLIAPAGSGLALQFDENLRIAEALGNGRLAIGDPDHVPAGIYARQAFQALGLWHHVRDRLAPAADVRAAVALVARREAPLGVVYATDARAFGAVETVGSFPPESHEAIVYPVALVAGRDNAVAQRFLDFLSEPDARAAFARAGFVAP